LFAGIPSREYFLLRPKGIWDESSTKQHQVVVATLKGHVKAMLSSLEHPDPEITQSGKMFVDILREACDKEVDKEELFQQSCLEMLLAATDTSSVTAYYTLLGLACDKTLQQDLRHELRNNETATRALLDSVVYETLRLKPVGPVVLRMAEDDDPSFPAGPLKKGTAILIHLAEMNLEKELWPLHARKFLPRRFLSLSATQEFFYPFGMGPKGCIGMHLGRKEVNSIVEAVIRHYELEIVGNETLESLETHWDIANQPDEPIRIRLRRLLE
jgi:aromatase